MKIIKRCIYCDGEIKPIEDFFKQNGEDEYNKIREEFKKKFGKELPKSEDYNCIECGQVYDKNLKPIKLKIGWLAKQKRDIKDGSR